jgi:hypothetical protein
MSDKLEGNLDVPTVDLDAGAAHTIAAGMREVAMADGAHPEEIALIDAFESSLPPGPTTVDLSTLGSDSAKAAFIQSLVLVAYADGKVTEAERDIIRAYSTKLGFDDKSLARVWTDVAVDLLSTFSGVTVFRGAIESIGRTMGLGDSDVDRALTD